MDAAVREHAGAGQADLALVRHERQQGRLGSRLDVAILTDDVGGLAAQLHRLRDDVAAGILDDLGGGRPGSGEGDLTDLRMGHQRLADGGPITGHDIDDARRQQLRNRLHELQH
jgi:hypothetical protein